MLERKKVVIKLIFLSGGIHAGKKQGCDKINIPLRNASRNTRPGWKIRSEGQIKHNDTNETTKPLKDKNTMKLKDKKKRQLQTSQTTKLEEINLKKLLAGEM